jgi:release factor glutamine methyltransferase
VTTVDEARRVLAASFRDAGLDSPDLDARILVGHALSLDHAGVVSAARRVLGAPEAMTIDAYKRRRLAGEPVARIVGTREFWGMPFVVTPAVLLPRPETETLVELALELTGDRHRALHVADLGTGSGAILLALLSELKNATGIGTDIDENALRIARENARNLGMENRVGFLTGNYGAALKGAFDLVVSNPPYIATATIATLAPEVQNHDPRAALDGGTDGLDAYRAIAADARRLIGNGHLAVEIGAGQGNDVAAIFASAGLALTAIRNDLAGMPRVVAARAA